MGIELTKNAEVSRSKVFADPWFVSEQIELNNMNADELLGVQHKHLSSRVERGTYEGSGWIISSIIQHQLCYIQILKFCK